MKTWVYRTLLGLCAAVALAGCVSISIGLKNKYDNYQAEVTKQKAKDIATLARAGFSFDIAKKVLGFGPDDLE